MAGWPWPLDAVQNWFEGLWNHTGNVVSYFAGQIINDVTSAITGQENFFNNLMDGVVGDLEPLFDSLYDEIQKLPSIIGGIPAAISILIIDEVSSAITGQEAFFTTKLDDFIGDVQKWSNSIVTEIEKSATSLWGNIKGAVDNLNKSLEQFIADNSEYVVDEIDKTATESGQNIDEIMAAIDASYGGINSQIEISAASIWDSTLGLSSDLLGGMATKLGESLTGFFENIFLHLSRYANLVIGAVQFIVEKVSGAVQGLIAWFTDSITGALMKGSPPQEIAVASQVLMETSFDRQFDMIDNIYQSEASSEDTIMSAQGLMGMLFAGGAVALSMAIAADQVHPLKNMGWRPTVRELVYWAGIPSVTAAIAVLPSSVGLLTPLRYALYERWTPLVPDAPDLIRFAVREVFIEEERERLIKPSPGKDFYKYMAKQGYSQKWADSYWASHWVRPTITQLTQMFYRDILDREQWEREVRLNDYVPYAIDWLEKIVHPPYTRVDIRRMWDMRTITSSDMLREYKWLGYDDEHAKGMVLWTKVYTALPDLVARYKNGWISKEDILQELLTLGMPEERAIELLQTKMKAEQEERISGERDLTKTDTLKLLGIGEISDSQAKDLLMSIGYDENEATYLIAIQLDRMVDELKELTSAQILKAYKFEIYDRAMTLDKLVEAGWSATAAETMLRLEDVRLADTQVERQRERDLTRTDIMKAMANEIISQQTAFEYLAYLGYSEWEIAVIFSLAGI